MDVFIFYTNMCKNTKGFVKFLWMWLESLTLAPAHLWITLHHPFTQPRAIILLPRIVARWLSPSVISAFYLTSFSKARKGNSQLLYSTTKKAWDRLWRNGFLYSPASWYLLWTWSALRHRAAAGTMRISGLPTSSKCKRNKRFYAKPITAAGLGRMSRRASSPGRRLMGV